MKIHNKHILTIIISISIIIMSISTCFGIVAKDAFPHVVSKGVATILSCMQIIQYVVPILFLIVKIIINETKHNNKNNIKNICLYLVISIVIFFIIFGLGKIILENATSYGYSSKTTDYIKYNGEIVYYHR